VGGEQGLASQGVEKAGRDLAQGLSGPPGIVQILLVAMEGGGKPTIPLLVVVETRRGTSHPAGWQPPPLT
jgi:hypothetical protein